MAETELLESPASTEASSTPAAPAEVSDLDAAAFDLPTVETSADEPQYVEDSEVAPAEEAPTEEAAAEVVEESGFDETLLATAERYGFTKEKAELFGSPQALQEAVFALDRQAAAWGKAQLGIGQQQQSAVNEQQAQSTQNTEQAQQEVAAAFEKFKLEANAEEWDENTLKAVNGLNDHYHDLVSKQQQEMTQMRDLLVQTHDYVSQITSQQQQAEGLRLTREVDTFLTSLGDEFRELYGQGSFNELKQDSDQWKNRQELVWEMHALEMADAHRGKPPMARTEMLKRANASLHSDLIKNTARKELTQKIDERHKQTLARPAGSQSKPQTPEEKALRTIREMLPRVS